MRDLYDDIVSNRGTMRNWMDKIPGLRGYMDKGDRRKADRMLREYVAEQLSQQLSQFVALEKRILRMDGGMSLMSSTREAKTKFQTYIDKVRAAPPGYSGFFAAIDVDEEAMDNLYAFDEAQVRYVDQMAVLNDKLEAAITAEEGVEGVIQEIYDLAQTALRAFSLREDVLTKLDQKYS